MKSWWEETETRAHRERTPATLGLAFWQRLRAVGIDPDLAHAPAYDLGHLSILCADLVKLVDGLLTAADGDTTAIRRQAITIDRWTRYAVAWTESTQGSFNRLLDSMELDPDKLAQREEIRPPFTTALPEEQSKVDGRYRYYHLILERIDLKFASINIPADLHLGLSRSLARLYEESLVTLRLLHGCEREHNPRFSHISRMLLEVNTTWHFDLGPHLLGSGRLAAGSVGRVGLQTFLLLAFSIQKSGQCS